MKFQNISIHGSKVMLCTRKRDERTNVTNERTNKPEVTFKVGGIINRSLFHNVCTITVLSTSFRKSFFA